ncbi:MAG: hypothetical protein RDV48_12945 [Candidatus Eremiobacteraeota bacterium]|nr:hypothetical protein [Candidatus Eremiobacteraeota bacterium]
MESHPCEQLFAIEQAAFHFRVSCPDLREVLSSYLSYYRETALLPGAFHFKVSLEREPPGKIREQVVSFVPGMTPLAGFFAPPSQAVDEEAFFQLYRSDERLFFMRGINEPALWAEITPSSLSARAVIAPGVEARGWGFRQLFLVILQELMKHAGFTPLHAACAASEGKGVLIIAPSGAGKTTTTLSLVKGGFEFLSDDTVFLRARGGAPEIVPFCEKVKALPATLSFFKELRPLCSRPFERGADKHFFPVEEFFGKAPLRQVRPSLLLFLTPPRTGSSSAVAISSREAFEGIIAQSGIVGLNRSAARESFSLMAELVRETRSVAFSPGGDLREIPHAVRRLIP